MPQLPAHHTNHRKEATFWDFIPQSNFLLLKLIQFIQRCIKNVILWKLLWFNMLIVGETSTCSDRFVPARSHSESSCWHQQTRCCRALHHRLWKHGAFIIPATVWWTAFSRYQPSGSTHTDPVSECVSRLIPPPTHSPIPLTGSLLSPTLTRV